MASREARIGFIVGALTGAGLALVWTSKQDGSQILGNIGRASEIVENQARNVAEFVDEATVLAVNTTRRFDEASDVVHKNLISSVLELAAVLRDLAAGIDRLFHKPAA